MSENETKIGKLEYYKSICREKLSKYPQSFKDFVADKIIVDEGDRLLSSGQSTAYNFATESNFPLRSRKPLIIYNNYIQRHGHFAELLSAMDSQGLIDKANFKFGAKATKVLGNWNDKETVVSKFQRNGKEEEFSESVEGCLILQPKDAIQAIAMINFLDLNTRMADDITYINGSWSIPDIRSTGKLKKILTEVGCKVAYAHYLFINSGNLIILKKDKTIIDKSWKSHKVLVNKLLYNFID